MIEYVSCEVTVESVIYPMTCSRRPCAFAYNPEISTFAASYSRTTVTLCTNEEKGCQDDGMDGGRGSGKEIISDLRS